MDGFQCEDRRDQTSRAISTARLKRLRAVHLRPINLVVSQGPSGTLRSRSVILGRVSHLDAFSGYLRATSLPGDTLGRIARTRAVASSRSSRTRDDVPQHSHAHDGYRPNCLTTF